MNLKHTLAITLIAVTGVSIAKSHSVSGQASKTERALVAQAAKCTSLTSALDGTNTPRTAAINTEIQTVCTQTEHLASVVLQQKSQHPSTYETLVALNGTTIYLSPQQAKRMCSKPANDKMAANCKTVLDLLK